MNVLTAVAVKNRKIISISVKTFRQVEETVYDWEVCGEVNFKN